MVGACSGASRARTGEPAPPVTGTTLDGQPFDLGAYRGRPVILNFWASWCLPCREEFPLLRERLGVLGTRDGLAIVGVLFKDDPAPATAFVDDFGAAWPTVTDPDRQLAEAYGVVAPPQTYFIDRDGVLRAIHIGQILPEDFDALYPRIAP